MLHFTKYLLFELICYLVCNIRSFPLKIFIIECVELVPVNIVINKPVLYWYQCCRNYMRLLDNICQRIYPFSYNKSWIFPNGYWPWFNFNYIMYGIDTPPLIPLQEFHYGSSIFRSMGNTQFPPRLLVSYRKNQLQFPYHLILPGIRYPSRVLCPRRPFLYPYMVTLPALL